MPNEPDYPGGAAYKKPHTRTGVCGVLAVVNVEGLHRVLSEIFGKLEAFGVEVFAVERGIAVEIRIIEIVIGR